jgi:hypothetical protein
VLYIKKSHLWVIALKNAHFSPESFFIVTPSLPCFDPPDAIGIAALLPDPNCLNPDSHDSMIA